MPKLSPSDIGWLVLIVFSVISSSFLFFITYFIFRFEINFANGIDVSHKGLDLLSATSYLANALVAIIACFSILFVRTQIKHGEASRIATIYMDLDKRYHEDEVQYSLRCIKNLLVRFDLERVGEEALEDFAHKHLAQLRREHELAIRSDPKSDTEYPKYVRFIMLLEYVGILVKRKYLREKDVFDLFGRDIFITKLVMNAHITWIREECHKDDRVLANTTALMEMAKPATKKWTWLYRK